MLSFEQAREKIIAAAAGLRHAPATETLALLEALGRVLLEPVIADRDYPPFHRSTRDGFAVRAADLAAAGRTLDIIGEIKAGDSFAAEIRDRKSTRLNSS